MRHKYQPLRASSAHPHSEDSSKKKTRRDFLARSAGIVGATVTGLAAAEQPPAVPKWMQEQGAPLNAYGQRSKFEESVRRYLGQPYGAIAPGSGVARSPIQAFEGTITPASLHFERSHNGVPAINPAEHRLMIHGLVKRPLIFSMDTLWRYPMTTRTCFLECSGNSNPNALNPKPPQVPCGAIHGLVSCSEWTGVPLSILLNEAGIEPRASWILAEGADAV